MGWTGYFPRGAVLTAPHQPEKQPMDTTVAPLASIGVDIGKEVFHLAGFGADGKIAFRSKIKRLELIETCRKLSPCIVSIEACPSAHFVSRALRKLGQPGSRRKECMNGSIDAPGAWWPKWLFSSLSADEVKDACVYPSRPRPTYRSNRPDTYQRLPLSAHELTCDQQPVHTFGPRRSLQVASSTRFLDRLEQLLEALAKCSLSARR
jgi:hypothetical protein